MSTRSILLLTGFSCFILGVLILLVDFPNQILVLGNLGGYGPYGTINVYTSWIPFCIAGILLVALGWDWPICKPKRRRAKKRKKQDIISRTGQGSDLAIGTSVSDSRHHVFVLFDFTL